MDELVAQAEVILTKYAEKRAYELSDQFKDKELCMITFNLYKSLILEGARVFQEELLNLIDDGSKNQRR